MEINFKILEVDGVQVLVMKDFTDDEQDNYMIVVTFFINGLKMAQKFQYDDREKRDQMFEKVSGDLLIESVKNAKQMTF